MLTPCTLLATAAGDDVNIQSISQVPLEPEHGIHNCLALYFYDRDTSPDSLKSYKSINTTFCVYFEGLKRQIGT